MCIRHHRRRRRHRPKPCLRRAESRAHRLDRLAIQSARRVRADHRRDSDHKRLRRRGAGAHEPGLGSRHTKVDVGVLHLAVVIVARIRIDVIVDIVVAMCMARNIIATVDTAAATVIVAIVAIAVAIIAK